MKDKEYTCGGCITLVVIWLVVGFICAHLLNYDIGFWTKYLKGEAKQIPMLYAFLISLIPIIGHVSIVVAIITFIFSFCI